MPTNLLAAFDFKKHTGLTLKFYSGKGFKNIRKIMKDLNRIKWYWNDESEMYYWISI